MTAPTSMPKPPLEDPLNERELFASEIVSVGAMHGNITITLANTRFDEPIGANPAKAHRIVAGRIRPYWRRCQPTPRTPQTTCRPNRSDSSGRRWP